MIPKPREAKGTKGKEKNKIDIRGDYEQFFKIGQSQVVITAFKLNRAPKRWNTHKKRTSQGINLEADFVSTWGQI